MKANKNKFTAARTALLAAGGMLLSLSTAVSAPVEYSNGDVLMAFRATGGTGATQNVVVNLGAAANFRENSSIGGLSNIGGILSDTFGQDWFSRGDVRVGVMGLPNFGNMEHPIPALRPEAINGDPGSTLYISDSRGLGDQWYVNSNPPSLQTSAADANNFRIAFANQQAVEGSNGTVAVYAASSTNSWSSKINEMQYIFQLYTANNVETVLDGSDASLDFYRVLASNTGANPTGDVGYAQWVTTFTVDEFGNLSAVPEPGVYAALIGVVGLLFVVVRRNRRSK